MTNQETIALVADRCQGNTTKQEFITLAITALVVTNGITPREAIAEVLGQEAAKLIPAHFTGNQIMEAVLSD